MKWQMPLSSGVSWREPRRTQIPAVTDRRPGMCSVKTVMPLGSLVERISSIMNSTIKNRQKLTQLRILACYKPAAKRSPNGRRPGFLWLDSALIIGGKCELFNGSGKSPGLNQLPSAGEGEATFQ